MELVNASIGPLAHLSETINLTLDQVAEWIANPRNRKRVTNLVTLLDAQAQLLLCQHRVVAVAQLARVANEAQSPETVRRACHNLLRIRLIDPYKEDVRPEVKADVDPIQDEAKVRAGIDRRRRMLSILASQSHLSPVPAPGITGALGGGGCGSM